MNRSTSNKLFMMGLASIIFFAGCSPDSGELTKRDVSRCVALMNNAERDRCFLNMAEAQKDPALCEKIGDVGIRNFCLKK